MELTRNQKFEALKNNYPDAGSILCGETKEDISVFVEFKDWVDPQTGKEEIRRTMYVHAIIDSECTGWYLTNMIKGIKVLILPNSQVELVRSNGNETEGISVKSLRIVRVSKARTSLVSEIV